MPMPKVNPEAKLWYYEDFLTAVKDLHLFPERKEDWSRLQVWEDGKLVPVMPQGFSGTPTIEQMEHLYAHMMKGTLFLFPLGSEMPHQIYYSHLRPVSLNPQMPAPLVRPDFKEIPKPEVPDPSLMDNPEELSQQDRENYRSQWQRYHFAFGEQERQKSNFKVTEDQYNLDVKIYEDNMQRLEELGQNFRKEVESYNTSRNLPKELQENEVRTKNKDLQIRKRRREKADYVIDTMMSNDPSDVPELFYRAERKIPGENGEVVPMSDRGKLQSDALFEYKILDLNLAYYNYKIPQNSGFDAHDVATINFACLGAMNFLEPRFANAHRDGGPLTHKNDAEQTLYMITSAMFGVKRQQPTDGAIFKFAMIEAREDITLFTQGNPSVLASVLLQCVHNIKVNFTGGTELEFGQDMMSASRLAERILDLYERKPILWESHRGPQKYMDFLRGYVQMGKIYDKYLDSKIKLNEAETLGQEPDAEEKLDILTNAVIRRMVDREFAKDNVRTEASEEYNHVMEEAVAKDMAAEAEFQTWRNKYAKDLPEDKVKAEYQKSHDLGLNVTIASRYDVDHKVIKLLGKPGMMERLQETLRKDPEIIALANQKPFPIKAADLEAGAQIDALAERFQPAMVECAYTDVQKYNWFVDMKAMVTRGKVEQRPDAISSWINPRVQNDAGRLMVAREDANGNKTIVPVVDLLENGLRSLNNPDQKTINLLHNYAEDGDLYYYDVGKDMPIRLNANGEKASFEQLSVPFEPTGWMKFWNKITFGRAYAEECAPKPKDRDPGVVAQFVAAKAARGSIAKDEAANRRREAPKKVVTVPKEELWHNQVKGQTEESKEEQAQKQAYDDIHSFKIAPSDDNVVEFPKHDKKNFSFKFISEIHALSVSNSAYLRKEGNDLCREINTALTVKPVSVDKIREFMAHAVLIETIRKESLSDKEGPGPVEKLMSDPKTRKEMIKQTMENPIFRRYTKYASMEMLGHFFLIDGARAMEDTITKAGLEEQKKKERANKGDVPAVKEEKKEQILGMD